MFGSLTCLDPQISAIEPDEDIYEDESVSFAEEGSVSSPISFCKRSEIGRREEEQSSRGANKRFTLSEHRGKLQERYPPPYNFVAQYPATPELRFMSQDQGHDISEFIDYVFIEDAGQDVSLYIMHYGAVSCSNPMLARP